MRSITPQRSITGSYIYPEISGWRVLAFYEGIPGGTEYTINYAVSLGKEVIYI